MNKEDRKDVFTVGVKTGDELDSDMAKDVILLTRAITELVTTLAPNIDVALSSLASTMGHIVTHLRISDEEAKELLQALSDKMFEAALRNRGSPI